MAGKRQIRTSVRARFSRPSGGSRRVLYRALAALVALSVLAACTDEEAAVPETPAQEVTGFSLLDADTGRSVLELSAGETLELEALPPRLSLRAHTRPETVGSVRFTVGGEAHTDNAAPYTFFKEAWAAGRYTVTATPYTEAGAKGVAGTPSSVTFSVRAPAQEPPKPKDARSFLYVLLKKSVAVYDMDNGYKLVKTLDTPDVDRIWGVTAHAPSGMMYFSYHDRSGAGGKYETGVFAYDLLEEKVVWKGLYRPFVDSLEVTPDGKRLYMATGEATNRGDFWFVLDAATGKVLDKIFVHRGAHNTIVSLDGRRVYMGSVRYPYLVVADTATNEVIRKIGPFRSGVRPFTVNGAQTLAFVNVNQFLGFEVGDVRTGKKLYSVRVPGFPERRWREALDVQSHGVALTPDEREVWVADNHNRALHIFDATPLPGGAPKYVESIRLKKRPNWIAFSRDGRFAHASGGEVINAETREVAFKTAESKIRVQIDWRGGRPFRAFSRYGLGYATGEGP